MAAVIPASLKKQMKVGFWNIRTRHATGKAVQVASEMRGYEL